MRLGFHVSIAGGWEKALQRAIHLRCTALQVFTSPPVQWAREPLDLPMAQWFGQALRAMDIQPLFVHAVYLLNLATDDPKLWRRSRDHLAEELERAALLGAEGVVVHLGSVGAAGHAEHGLQRVAQACDYALSRADPPLTVLLENCAGQGNLVGCTPEALAQVIQRARHAARLRVCLDTAHAFAWGYTVHTAEGLSAFLDRCQAAFGLHRLALVHANDSRTALGSRVDRHYHIGKGHIGTAGFRAIMNEPRLAHLPFIMETPAEGDWDERNMRALRAAINRENRPPLLRVRSYPPSPL